MLHRSCILPAGDTSGAKIESVSTQEHLGHVEDAPFDSISMAAGTMGAKDSMSASCINMTDQKITAAGCSRMQTVGDRIVTSCVQVIEPPVAHLDRRFDAIIRSDRQTLRPARHFDGPYNWRMPHIRMQQCCRCHNALGSKRLLRKTRTRNY